MEIWGSEFVDDGGHGNQDFLTPAIWYVPMDLMEIIVDKSYLREIARKNPGKIEGIKNAMLSNKDLGHGLLVFDKKTLRLQDGNHRYLVYKELEKPWYPAKFSESGGIVKAPGAPISDIMLKIFSELFNHT